MIIETTTIDTSVGTLELAVRDDALVALEFAGLRRGVEQSMRRRFGDVEFCQLAANHRVIRRLRDYFAGDIRAVDDIDVDTGGTKFQQAVWRQLRRIPAGTTASYGEVARAIDAAGAVRAVGTANGANPIAIVVPCHRVVRTSGDLGGYGGGLDRKRWLLEHERATEKVRIPAGALL